MTISETITYLEKLKEERGDKHIEFGNDATDSVASIEELTEFSDDGEKITLGVFI